MDLNSIPDSQSNLDYHSKMHRKEKKTNKQIKQTKTNQKKKQMTIFVVTHPNKCFLNILHIKSDYFPLIHQKYKVYIQNEMIELK